MSELYAAFCLYISICWRSFSRSSSQRRRFSSSRSCRARRASCQEANPPGCTHAEPPSTATTRSAVWASSSRSCETYSTDLSDSLSRASSHRFAGTSRKLSGSSSSSTSSEPRSSSSSAKRFCCPPDRVATGRSRTFSQGRSRAATATVSNSTSASYPPDSPQAVSACAYRSWVFWSDSARCRARSAAASRSPASRTAGGPSASARAFSDISLEPRLPAEPAATIPMNWRITPRPPERAITPDCTGISPATIRRRVVLPAPFGPISAILAPSPTRNETSANSTRPSGSVCPTPATSTYPMGVNCSPWSARRHLEYPVPLLRGVPVDRPALPGQPRLERVGAEVPGHHQPGGTAGSQPG